MPPPARGCPTTGRAGVTVIYSISIMAGHDSTGKDKVISTFPWCLQVL